MLFVWVAVFVRLLELHRRRGLIIQLEFSSIWLQPGLTHLQSLSSSLGRTGL